MSLAEKVSDDVKSALKSGDKKKLAIARFLSSELKNFLIKENLDRELSKISDDNFFKIVKTQVKQKKESLEYAEKAKDSNMIDTINYEFTANDFGKIMGLLKKTYNNQIDLNLASNIIKKIFSE